MTIAAGLAAGSKRRWMPPNLQRLAPISNDTQLGAPPAASG
jgi:hypothetical protein